MTTAPAPAPTDAGQGPEPAAEPVTPEPVAPVATEPAATEPAATPEVQPAETDATTQPDGGQGLIAPYLEGVDPQHRDVVAAALDKYRADSDAQITHRFEELNGYKQFAESPAELEAPVYLYERLMDEPKATVQWIFDEFEKAGIDLRSQLLGEATAPAATDPAAAPAGETADDQPLTREQVREEFERLEQDRENQRQQGQEATQRKELVEGWLTEATKAQGLELEEGDAAVRQAVLTHAAQLLPQLKHLGDGAGKAAVTTAVEAFVNRFGKTPAAPAADQTPEPTVANGGTPPAPAEVTDLSDPKVRRAHMLSLITASSNNQE